MSKLGVIKLSIDVTKIDKDSIYHGKKGKYMDVTVFLDDEPDHYGQYGMITQEISQQRRDAGEKGPILGNVKKWYPAQDNLPQQPPSQQSTGHYAETGDMGDGDSIPF